MPGQPTAEKLTPPQSNWVAGAHRKAALRSISTGSRYVACCAVAHGPSLNMCSAIVLAAPWNQCGAMGCDHYMCVDHRYVLCAAGESVDQRCIHCTGASATPSAPSSTAVVDERKGTISFTTPETGGPGVTPGTTTADANEETPGVPPPTRCSGHNLFVGEFTEEDFTSLVLESVRRDNCAFVKLDHSTLNVIMLFCAVSPCAQHNQIACASRLLNVHWRAMHRRFVCDWVDGVTDAVRRRVPTDEQTLNLLDLQDIL